MFLFCAHSLGHMFVRRDSLAARATPYRSKSFDHFWFLPASSECGSEGGRARAIRTQQPRGRGPQKSVDANTNRETTLRMPHRRVRTRVKQEGNTGASAHPNSPAPK